MCGNTNINSNIFIVSFIFTPLSSHYNGQGGFTMYLGSDSIKEQCFVRRTISRSPAMRRWGGFLISDFTAVVGIFWGGVKMSGKLFEFWLRQKKWAKGHVNFLISKFTWPFDEIFCLIKIQTTRLIFWLPLKILPPQQCQGHFISCQQYFSFFA